MYNKREHMIGACLASRTNESSAFAEVVEQSKSRFDGKGIVVSTPPPERDIYLHLKPSTGGDIASVSLKRYFGFAVDAEFLFESGNIRAEAFSLLDGIFHRLVRDNAAIKYYGVKITCFADPARFSEEDCSKLYQFLSKWCGSLRNELKVFIAHDLARDQHIFDNIMLNEHLRMVHGDIQHQYEQSSSSPWN
jgi:hypothetical protein